jgi:DNA-binding Xre family transcriptional regulator
MKNKTMAIYEYRVGEILQEKGWTISHLASEAGISYRAAHAIVHNNTKGMRLEMVSKLCHALKVAPGELFRTKQK